MSQTVISPLLTNATIKTILGNQEWKMTTVATVVKTPAAIVLAMPVRRLTLTTPTTATTTATATMTTTMTTTTPRATKPLPTTTIMTTTTSVAARRHLGPLLHLLPLVPLVAKNERRPLITPTAVEATAGGETHDRGRPRDYGRAPVPAPAPGQDRDRDRE